MAEHDRGLVPRGAGPLALRSTPSYLAGVGVNAIIPARGGDAVRLFLAHRAVPGSTYITLGSTLLVLSIFDMAMALLIFVYALTLGVLPASARSASCPASTSASSRPIPSSRPSSSSCS